MVILAGFGMTAMGLGLIPVDPKLGAVARVYTDALKIPLRPFLVFLGVTKTLSVLKLWNVAPVPISPTLAFLGLAAPAASAVYGHAKVEGASAAIPPTVYLCLLGSLFYLDRGDTAKAKAS
jgi:hypothetical protein